MKKLTSLTRCSLWLSLVVVAGCEEGDPTALKQAVEAADLNIVSITVEPANGTIKAGYDYPFTAIGTRPDGSTTDITDNVSWASSNTAVATVNSNGVVATTSDGTTTISATLASLTGSTLLTASSEELQSIRVDPDSAAISACGQLQLNAFGSYGPAVDSAVERTIIPITRFVNWAVSSGPGQVDSLGLVTATSNSGTINVTASLDGVTTAPVIIDISLNLDSIAVTPASPTIGTGETLQFMATGTYSNNSTANITRRVDWSTGSNAVATINPDTGLATGVAAGATEISAACGSGPTGSTTLTVSDVVLDYLRFQDQNDANVKVISIPQGTAIQIDLEAYYTDGSHETVTESAQWSTLDGTGNIATVDNSTDDKGIITGQSQGERAVIEATYNNREKILIVNVTAPTN